jgi:lysophospholipase L1-like esterase
MEYGKIILFGDSITEYGGYESLRFQSKLTDLYTRKLDVVNRGFGGYNSSHGRVILPRLLEAELNSSKSNIKLMTIFFGSNDASEPVDELSRLQHVPLETYKLNIRTMVKMAVDNNIKPIVVGPGLNDNRLSRARLMERERRGDVDLATNEKNHLYSMAAQEVAQEFGVAFVDLWNLFRIHGNWTQEQLYASTGDSPDDKYIALSHLFYDGIHFTPAAYEIFTTEVLKAIKSHYPEVWHENLPQMLPHYSQIDPANVEKTIFP